MTSARTLLALAAVVAMIAVVHARYFSRCELVQHLRQLGAREDQVGTWACIAQHESSYNTAAEGKLNADGSIDHGIFQISELFWCGKWGPGGGCGVSCASLRDDDITNDFQCVRTIWNEHQRLQGNGFLAWTVYQGNCVGQNEAYKAGCGGGC